VRQTERQVSIKEAFFTRQQKMKFCLCRRDWVFGPRRLIGWVAYTSDNRSATSYTSQQFLTASNRASSESQIKKPFSHVSKKEKTCKGRRDSVFDLRTMPLLGKTIFKLDGPLTNCIAQSILEKRKNSNNDPLKALYKQQKKDVKDVVL
jgi:hypothetical protein